VVRGGLGNEIVRVGAPVGQPGQAGVQHLEVAEVAEDLVVRAPAAGAEPLVVDALRLADLLGDLGLVLAGVVEVEIAR
jgi:hypothetical protein